MSSAIAFLLVLFAGTSHRIRADRKNPSGERIEDFIQKLTVGPWKARVTECAAI